MINTPYFLNLNNGTVAQAMILVDENGSVINVGENTIIAGSVLNYAALPTPASEYTGKLYYVQTNSGGSLSVLNIYKYPKGFYSPNALDIWEQTSMNVKVAEDATTMTNIINWTEFYNYAFDIAFGDRVIFHDIVYKNISGNFSTTDPSLDITNWSVIDSDSTAIGNRVTVLENTLIKVSYYAEITTSSGQITVPTGAQILLNQWPDGVDAILSEISGGKPVFSEPGIDVIDFDTLGNYETNGPLPSSPYALIYYFNISLSDYKNLNKEYLIVYAETKITSNGTGTGVPMYINLIKTSQVEGNLHFNDTFTWYTDKAIIKSVKVVTDSTNWDLYLLQNGNGYLADDASVPAKTLMMYGNLTEAISMDYSYEDEDESKSIHLYWVDNSGTNTADFYISGFEME